MQCSLKMNNISKQSSPNKLLAKLKVISINVNSIAANWRRASLVKVLKEQNPDVVFLVETKLKSYHAVRLKDYNIIRDDRNSKYGGGTAIIIRKNI